MKQYRVKIETNNDGTKWYEPQERVCSFLGYWLSHKSINKDGGAFFYLKDSYSNLDDAEKAIKTRKEKLEEEYKHNVNETKYKYYL